MGGPAATLAAEGITAGYGRHPVLVGASVTLPPGVRTALLGANGSGKTTLLKVLSGALEPTAGTIRVGDRVLRRSRAALAAHRQLVQLVLQDPDDQLFSADVGRDVSFGPTNLGLPRGEVAARVAEALDLLGIVDLADRPTHALSYGQRKRVAIAGALAMRPSILLLDEPTAGLDPCGVDDMIGALRRLERHGTTVLLATHDVDLALSWAGRALVLHRGAVRVGEPAEVLTDPELLRLARLRTPTLIEVCTRLGLDREVLLARPPRTPKEAARLVAEHVGDSRQQRGHFGAV